MSDELIIRHCAPTFAGIKTANMFTVDLENGKTVNDEIRALNVMLRGKGLRVIPLKETDSYALIYIYRPDYLRKDLEDPKAKGILCEKGYDCINPEYCIAQLIERLKKNDGFPHEVGLFLGYPPGDVEGFIKDPSSGVKCCGCWKVYSDKDAAIRKFKRFDKCTKIYCDMNKKGKTLLQLAVNKLKNATA